VAVSPDGRLAVVDLTSGSLAYADTTSLTIDRVVPVARSDGAAGLMLAADGRRTFVGGGDTVTVLDRGTDAVTARWSVPGPVRGLGLSPDATLLYAGGTDEVVWLDAGSGALRGRMAVDGLTALRHVR
jgi:DNA-binding beta-propeller fold protein YncE